MCPISESSITGTPTPCSNGFAGNYSCNNINLLSFVSLQDLGSNSDADGYVSFLYMYSICDICIYIYCKYSIYVRNVYTEMTFGDIQIVKVKNLQLLDKQMVHQLLM